jgi:hypothetical protein
MPFAKWAVPVFDYLIDLMAKNMSGARQDRFLECDYSAGVWEGHLYEIHRLVPLS